MIGAVMENLIGGYLHPRASVRRLLAGGHGLEAAIAMLLLAFLLYEIFLIIVPGVRTGEDGISFSYYGLALIESLVVFGLYAAGVYFIGRMFGGQGTFEQTALVVSWLLVVTSLPRALAAPAVVEIYDAAQATAESPASPPEVPADAMVTLLVVSGLMLWLLASYIAELHRFERTWRVLFAILGVSVLFSFVFSGLMPAA